MGEATKIEDTYFVEIDPFGGSMEKSLPSCDVVSCSWSVLDHPPIAPDWRPSRKLYRQVGGPNDGLRLCERCMEPVDLERVRQTEVGRG